MQYTGYIRDGIILKLKYVFKTWETFWTHIQEHRRDNEYIIWFEDDREIGCTMDIWNKHKTYRNECEKIRNCINDFIIEKRLSSKEIYDHTKCTYVGKLTQNSDYGKERYIANIDYTDNDFPKEDVLDWIKENYGNISIKFFLKS